jgi:hypothetical protein
MCRFCGIKNRCIYSGLKTAEREHLGHARSMDKSLFIGQVVDAGVFADEQPLGAWQFEGIYLSKD